MINSFLKGLDKFQIVFHFATSIFILWKFGTVILHLKKINLFFKIVELSFTYYCTVVVIHIN